MTNSVFFFIIHTISEYKTMADKLYTILELSTNGWHPIEGEDVQISKAKCDERIKYHLGKGVSPERLKAVVDNRNLGKKELDFTITGDTE